MPLRDPKGLLIGVISVDEPSSKRPTDDEIDALVAIASHAALALRMAQDTANDVQHQRMLEGILEVSARVAEADDPEDILQAVSDGIRNALGFDKVVIELAPRADMPLVPHASSGCSGEARVSKAITLDALEPLLTDEFEVAGCYLVPTEVADERLNRHPVERLRAVRPRPRRLGASLAARAADGASGAPPRLIWVDDPRDRLLPSARPGAPAVREPGGGGAPVGRPGAEAPPRGDPRRAHGPAQPARVPAPAATAGGRGSRSSSATWTT